MQKDLYDFVGCHFYNDRIDKHLHNTEEIKPILEEYRTKKEIGAFRVKNIDTKDGVKLYFDDDASWILVRPSGTEPLLRIYFESDSLDKIEQFKNYLR